MDRRSASECWPWLGKADRQGRGVVVFEGRTTSAPRLLFWLVHGRWPVTSALHRCDNPPCVNPRHVYEGTQQQNVMDRDARGRRTAPRGEAHGRARLSDADIATIRDLYRGGARQVDIAERFGTPQGYVSRIVRGAAR